MNDSISAPPRFHGGKIMPDNSKAELLRSLARLVRGLSALFWGLPLMLIFYVLTASTNWLDVLGAAAVLPPLIVTGLVFFGLLQMHGFQKQERIWIRALDRTQILVFINVGLCPFLYWWHKQPFIQLFGVAVTTLSFCGIMTLFNLNYVLERLTAMLPDETLREETRIFGSLNRMLIGCIPVTVAIDYVLSHVRTLPGFIIEAFDAISPFKFWLVIFLILMPLAMTMALIWKIKEVIFTSVFESED